MIYRVFNTSLLLSLCILVSACDKGKKPYEEAETFFSKSDYAAAKSKAAEVIQNAPKSEYLARAKGIKEKVEQIEAFLKIAQGARLRGDFEMARMHYESVLPLDSKCPEAIAVLPKLKEEYERESKLLQDGESFEKSGDWEKAIEAYKTILTFVPNDKAASSKLEYIFKESGNWEKAIETYKTILTFVPNDEDANSRLEHIEEYDYPSCCREEINKYRARRESMSDIREIFSQEASGENEFELKKDEERIKKERNEISRTTVFFDILSGVKVSGHDNDPYISEYDFKKQEYKVGFGVMRGSSGGEQYGIASSPDVIQIANDKGNRMEFTLKMPETEAESFDKEHIKLFVVYKFIKGEKFKHWDPLRAQLRGGDGSQEHTRIYIKPINVTLLSGDSKYKLYEAQDKK